MVRRQHAGAHERVCDRQAHGLGQSGDLGGGPACPAAREQQRSLGDAQLRRDRRRGRRGEGRPLDRRRRPDRRIQDLAEDVHGDRHEDRPRPAGHGEVPGAGHHPRQLVGTSDAPRSLHERLVDRDLIGVATEVDLLVWSSPLVVGRDVAGDDEQRDRVERGRRDAGHGVRHARPDMEEHDAWLARRPRVAVGGVCGDLLVPRRHEARSAGALERRQQGDVGVATQTEHHLDTAIRQEARDVVGCRHPHPRCSRATVSWVRIATSLRPAYRDRVRTIGTYGARPTRVKCQSPGMVDTRSKPRLRSGRFRISDRCS